MKIRIKGNSIRIRLSKSEVAMFAKDNYVEEKTDFGSNSLVYAVESTDEQNISATFEDGTIKMLVPKHLLLQWATTELVSLESNMPLDNNKYLYILLEKDFQCIDAIPTEDQSDYFENPSKAC